jgi:hypothetical protein
MNKEGFTISLIEELKKCYDTINDKNLDCVFYKNILAQLSNRIDYWLRYFKDETSNVQIQAVLNALRDIIHEGK